MRLHLKRQGNVSEYIRSLIRADMDIAKVQFNAEMALEVIVERRLRELVEAGAVTLAGDRSACPERRQGSPEKAGKLVESILGV